MASSYAGVRFEILNDVHGRWAPITAAKGGICIPDVEVTNFVEYKTACPNSLGGAARAVTAMDELSKIQVDGKLNDKIIRVLNGDEFTGTPMFSASKFSEENSGYGAALNHIGALMKTPTGITEAPELLLTLGNHELDLGIEVLGDYYEEMIVKHKAKLLCGNCNFTNDADCNWPVRSAYQSSETVIIGTDKKLGIWGMTVPDMHAVSVLPKACTTIPFDDERFMAPFDVFVKEHDLIVVISHMGLDQDIKFADNIEQRFASDNEKKVLIFGGHTHSIMCGGKEGLTTDLNGSKPQTDLDSNIPGGAGMVQCDVKADFDKAIMDLTTDYDSVKIAEVGFELPYYKLTVGTNTSIYHHGMYGTILGHLRITEDGDALVVDDTVAKYKILNSDVALDEATMTDQLKDINKLVALNSDYIGLADEEIGGNCSDAPSGCDGGYLLAMSLTTTGVDVLTPNIAGGPHYEGGVVGFVSGNSIISTLPEGQVSLGGIYSTYPFLNALSGMMVKGDNLIENLTHGIFGWGGGQMFGARVVLKENDTIDSVKAKYTTDAEAKGTTVDRYFCTDKYPGTTSGSKFSSYANRTAASESVTRADTTDVVDDARPDTPYAGKGCHKVATDDVVSFEINTCALAHIKEVRSSGKSTIDYFPPIFYNDCNCWEKIDATKEYMLISIDYVNNGGKGHCFQDAGTTRYDTSAPLKNGEVGCAATVIDFFSTFQNNISGGEGFQVATEGDHPAAPSSFSVLSISRGAVTIVSGLISLLF